ncbi:MAG TPA: metalloregulator ArsR/SmtB family transcription factor [Anaerolineales bacterium]
MNATTWGALSEPNRLRIVELLRGQPLPVGEIAARLLMRQPQVSKHLKVLSHAGLVQSRPVAQKHVYELQPQPFEDLELWLNTFRPTWSARMDALEAHLRNVKAAQKGKPGSKSR